MRRGTRSTPAGEHRPVMLDEVLRFFVPQPGEIAVDCTLGWGGHSSALAEELGPTGVLIAMDMDAENLAQAQARLASSACPVFLHHQNFAGIAQVLGEQGYTQADMILADLGMSSMQVDDSDRGFSYSRDGPLDMRMDRSRGKTAAQILQSIAPRELAQHLREWGDEVFAEPIADAIAERVQQAPLQTTHELAQLVQEVVGKANWRLQPTAGKWDTHPAARTFQALRILVNRELANLTHLLRIAPSCLRPGGRLALISFHSGEDRLVKNALREGLRTHAFTEIADDPLRPTFREKQDNPRARSAKLRWARKGTEEGT